MTKVLPNKAVKAGGYDKWVEMDDSYNFCFSLYTNDLIYIKLDKPFNLTSTNKQEKAILTKTSAFLYYKGIDVSTGAMTVVNHDNSFEGRLYIAKSKTFDKYVVDVLGNKSKVTGEKRNTLN